MYQQVYTHALDIENSMRKFNSWMGLVSIVRELPREDLWSFEQRIEPVGRAAAQANFLIGAAG